MKVQEQNSSVSGASPEQNPEQISTFRAIIFFIKDFVKVFVIALAIIIPVRWFLFQPFVVTGDSMRPSFQNGNYLIIDELSYRFRAPQRGEVVVMRFSQDPSQFFIKRIVGLPGERIVITEGNVTIYGSDDSPGLKLKEEYLPSNNITFGTIDRKLGNDEYFVLGDNRLSSSDSRIWGPLKYEQIIGRVYIRLFPLKMFALYKAPTFNFAQ